MFCALWGAFMISILVLTVGNYFNLNQKQKKALNHIKISRSAAKIISLSFKYFILKKEYFLIKKKIDPNYQSNFLQAMNNRDVLIK